MNSYMICDGNWSPYLRLVKLMQRLLGAAAWLSLPWCDDDGNMRAQLKLVNVANQGKVDI
eukprot:scaffold4380_cov53-Cyclotella_meneghiniana.AAC.6